MSENGTERQEYSMLTKIGTFITIIAALAAFFWFLWDKVIVMNTGMATWYSHHTNPLGALFVFILVAPCVFLLWNRFLRAGKPQSGRPSRAHAVASRFLAKLFPGLDLCPNSMMCEGCWLTVQMHVLEYYSTALDRFDGDIGKFLAATEGDHNPRNPASAEGHRQTADILMSCTRSKLDNDGIAKIAEDFQLLRPLIEQVKSICSEMRHVYDALNPRKYLDGDKAGDMAEGAIEEATRRAHNLRDSINKMNHAILSTQEEIHRLGTDLSRRLHHAERGRISILVQQKA